VEKLNIKNSLKKKRRFSVALYLCHRSLFQVLNLPHSKKPAREIIVTIIAPHPNRIRKLASNFVGICIEIAKAQIAMKKNVLSNCALFRRASA